MQSAQFIHPGNVSNLVSLLLKLYEHTFKIACLVSFKYCHMGLNDPHPPDDVFAIFDFLLRQQYFSKRTHVIRLLKYGGMCVKI